MKEFEQSSFEEKEKKRDWKQYFSPWRQYRMIIRWILTFLLYYYFWDIKWVRWSLWFVGPMILINLSFLLWFRLKFNEDKEIDEQEDLV